VGELGGNEYSFMNWAVTHSLFPYGFSLLIAHEWECQQVCSVKYNNLLFSPIPSI